MGVSLSRRYLQDMSLESGVVVIDLGLERGEPDSYRDKTRSATPRWFPAILMAALLLVVLGASGSPPKSPLSQVLRLQVGPGDTYTLTSAGTLVAQTYGELTSYDLDSGQVVWQAAEASSAYRLRQADGLVLMRPWAIGTRDPGTFAVALTNGASRWRDDGNVLTLPGSSTLLSVDPARNYAGTTRWVEGLVNALDPITGSTRWTVPVPGSGVVLGVPGPADTGARMLMVGADRTMTLYDLDDGRQLASTMIPIAPAEYGADNPAVAGGVILLRHPNFVGMQISAYDPSTLRLLWTKPAYQGHMIRECGMLACLVGDSGVQAIDPATGNTRWFRPQWKDIETNGTRFIAYAREAAQNPVGVIDPETGEVKVDLKGWRPVDGRSDGDVLLVTRAVSAGARTMVAVVRPGAREPRLLADLPAGTGDCEAVPDRLACRNMYGELVVWAYQER
jgi:outer membrane protein assembly factor BamB